jgi:hypothetical protein
MRQEADDRWLWRYLTWSAVVGALLFALGALLRQAAPNLVHSGTDPWPVEVWAGAQALAFLLMATVFAARRRERLPSLLPLAGLLFVAFVWLAFVREVSTHGPSWDFKCYYYAGKAVRHGTNIYSEAALGGRRYLYSPLLATVFSAAELLSRADQQLISYWVWGWGNYWATLAFLLLMVGALRLYGVTGSWLWIGMAAAVACNVPLQRTLIYSQVNLHVVNLMLGFLLLYRRRPALSGAMLAAASVLKSTPALLLIPVFVERRWKTAAGFVAGAAVLVGGSMAIVGTRPWVDFLHNLGGMQSHGHYRDNSISSLVINVGGLLGISPYSGSVALLSAALTLAAAAGLAYLAWHPRWRGVFAAAEEEQFVEGAVPFFLAAMLVASPLIWEHHWVFVQLSFCLLVARAAGSKRLLPALLCYGLVFLVPTFDVFPISYHRLAGLVWWVVLVGGMAGGETRARRKRRNM